MTLFVSVSEGRVATTGITGMVLRRGTVRVFFVYVFLTASDVIRTRTRNVIFDWTEHKKRFLIHIKKYPWRHRRQT